jgi:hypothetical protein
VAAIFLAVPGLYRCGWMPTSDERLRESESEFAFLDRERVCAKKESVGELPSNPSQQKILQFLNGRRWPYIAA